MVSPSSIPNLNSIGESVFLHSLNACAVNLYKWQYNIKTVQSHDVAPSLCCTTIYIDSPHMSRDGAGKLILLFYFKVNESKKV